MPEQEGSREWGIGSRGESDPHSPLPTPHSPNPTPGARAYAAYAHLLQTQWPMAVWQGLSRLERYAWEAAAQAVLAMLRLAVDDTGFAPPGWYRPQQEEEADGR